MAKIFFNKEIGKFATRRSLKEIKIEELDILGWKQINEDYKSLHFLIWVKEIEGGYEMKKTTPKNPLNDFLKEEGFILVKDYGTNKIHPAYDY